MAEKRRQLSYTSATVANGGARKNLVDDLSVVINPNVGRLTIVNKHATDVLLTGRRMPDGTVPTQDDMCPVPAYNRENFDWSADDCALIYLAAPGSNDIKVVIIQESDNNKV